jgi:hypothetical protein
MSAHYTVGQMLPIFPPDNGPTLHPSTSFHVIQYNRTSFSIYEGRFV